MQKINQEPPVLSSSDESLDRRESSFERSFQWQNGSIIKTWFGYKTGERVRYEQLTNFSKVSACVASDEVGQK